MRRHRPCLSFLSPLWSCGLALLPGLPPHFLQAGPGTVSYSNLHQFTPGFEQKQILRGENCF